MSSLPDEIPNIVIDDENTWICSVLKQASLTKSTSEAKRLIVQGAVKINQEKVSDPDMSLPKGEHIIQVGKRRFARIEIN